MPEFLDRLFGKKGDEPPMRDVVALVAPLAVPALHVVRHEGASRSHFGGTPQLPADVAWPEKDGARLAFLARLSLPELQAALPTPWLPADGALLFFYDIEQQPWGFEPKDRGGCAVLHVPDLDAPLATPDAAPAADDALPQRAVGFRRIDVPPSPQREPVAALQLTRAEFDRLIELQAVPFADQPKHQVGGYPVPMQGDEMELECQLVSHGVYCGDPSAYADPRVAALAAGAPDWRLLLQFDTDDDLGVMWGDCGTVYFWVPEAESRAGNFANTWLILQCG
jgi:uncharacterized protein YwqG